MSADADADLAGLLLRHVHELLAWLDDYPGDQVRAGAVADLRRSVAWVTAQSPPAGAGAALEVSAGLVADLMWWLDACADDDVDLHVAVKLQESAAAWVDDLTGAQRARLLEVLGQLAAGERHDGRRHALRLFPFAVGLTDDEPDEDEEPAVREWVRPEDRVAGG